MMYNIYYGTPTNNALKCQYRITVDCKSERRAKELAYDAACSFYYKNEGKFNLPGYNQIKKECDLTGVSLKNMYGEHIKDLLRWYAVPTELDTVSSKDLKY